MYSVLKFLSLVSFAFAICFSVIYGFLAFTGEDNGSILLAILFLSLLFGMTFILRAVSDIGTRLINIEKRLKKEE